MSGKTDVKRFKMKHIMNSQDGYQFYANYDETSDTVAIFLDSEGESYIGEVDPTMSDVTKYIHDWLSDKV